MCVFFSERFARITRQSLTLLFFKEIKSNSLTVAQIKERQEQFANGHSCLKSDERQSLTVALYYEPFWAKERIPNPVFYAEIQIIVWDNSNCLCDLLIIVKVQQKTHAQSNMNVCYSILYIECVAHFGS